MTGRPFPPAAGKRPAWELAVVLGFTALTVLIFLGKAYHMDEPLYLPAAWHILKDPLHPFSFEFNYYGRSLPYREINNTPPVIMYLLALGLKLTGGGERAMRLFFLPFDLAAAAGLYLLAGRFLFRPLLPVLIVLACPAYWINMAHLMPEKLVLAFGLWGLYGIIRWSDGRDAEQGHGAFGAWFWSSAGLMALAVLSKYNAVVLVGAGAGYAVLRGAPWRRVAAWGGLACSGLAAYLALDAFSGGAAPGAAWLVTRQASDMPTSALSHRLRSILAFLGGGGLVTAAWPFFVWRPTGKGLVLAAALLLCLFSPFLDLGPVRAVDRLTGILLSAGALLLLARAALAWGKVPGWELWLPWLGLGLAAAFSYWSVMARTVLLAIPPAVFCLAVLLESRMPARRYAALCLASLAAVFSVGLALSAVDARYADSQRTLAREISERYLDAGRPLPMVGGGGTPAPEPPGAGRRVWFTGHWGLQYYLERAGAKGLDVSAGGWDSVRAGDVVVVPSVNTNIIRPHRKVLANVTRAEVSSSIPARLMCASGCEAGFYSNVMGFLPFSLSAEPVDTHEIVEAL
ncbi:MAG: glycosyltransferase family 39 protein [Elusimicrobia bacterium]|nr:glycosyltransferase family 39 protein [Elusimicrobiota bacterium]